MSTRPESLSMMKLNSVSIGIFQFKKLMRAYLSFKIFSTRFACHLKRSGQYKEDYKKTLYDYKETRDGIES